MKKISDERLVLRNLKNIRIAYMVQTLGIIGILSYDFVTKGMEGLTSNPLWFVFLVTTVVSAYLMLNISVDHETKEKSPKKGLLFGSLVVVFVAVVVGISVALSEGFGVLDGLLFGGIVLVCGLAPAIYLYYIRKKREDE